MAIQWKHSGTVFLLFCYLWSVPSPGVLAQSSNNSAEIPSSLTFHHITEDDGLSYNQVTSLLKDKDGFLWVGTQQGLNRYDGEHFNIYKKTKESTSILHNSVLSLCEDLNGNIWGGTEDGIFCFDKKKKSFRNYYVGNSNSYPRIQNIICDHKGRIWATGYMGLLEYQPETDDFKLYKYDENDIYSLSSYLGVDNKIVLDPENKGIWIATPNGLNFLEFESMKFINHRNQKDSYLFNTHPISSVHVSPKGFIWQYDLQSSRIIGFHPGLHSCLYELEFKAIRSKRVLSIFESKKSNLFISTSDNETYALQYQNEESIKKVFYRENDPTSIAGDFFSSAWEDQDGTIWLGTVGGISLTNSNQSFFRQYRIGEIIPSLNANWAITCISENPRDSSWWIGTVNGQLIRFDPKLYTYNIIETGYLTKIKGYGPGAITNFVFHGDSILICNILNHPLIYNSNTKSLEIIQPFKSKFPQFAPVAIAMESDSTYLYSNNSNPLMRWNFKSNSVEELPILPIVLENGRHSRANWLSRGKDGSIWVTASPNHISKQLPKDQWETKSLNLGRSIEKSGYFQNFEVDKKGILWFSYYGQGMYSFDPHTDSLLNWTENEGLINNTLISVMPTENNQVWCASYNKFSVFNRLNGSFFNFSIPISTNNQIYYNYLKTLSNGHVLCNVRGTLVEFFPEKILFKPGKQQPLISTIRIADEEIINYKNEDLNLKPDQNFLNFKFGILISEEIAPFRYEYKMEGINEDWVLAGNNAEAVYTKLPSGSYTFQLRAVSLYNDWVSETLSIPVYIQTHFYNTWWFLIMVFGIVTYFGASMVRSRIQNMRNLSELKQKAQLLEKEKTQVMYENLKQHLNPHFLFNSLTSLGSLIRSDQQMAGDFLEKMSKVYRYILKNKDNESVSVKEELSFIQGFIQLQKTRFEDALMVNIMVPEEFHHRKIAPVTLQNLIENAIKHNVADDESPLIIEIFVEDNMIQVRNNLQLKNFVETSNKQGLKNMQSLYQFLSERPMIIEQTESFFTVKIPLL
ncbi:MAG: histidine kinase [Saprospiraceae bacterium]|nr:histidine kinase [Saprospiraceae bacterium]